MTDKEFVKTASYNRRVFGMTPRCDGCGHYTPEKFDFPIAAYGKPLSAGHCGEAARLGCNVTLTFSDGFCDFHVPQGQQGKTG
jgi:hypothetical protein